MGDIIRIDSVSQIHDFLGLEGPRHPLITVLPIDERTVTANYGNTTFMMDLFQISLKKGIEGNLSYGRNSYDFQDGTLIFTAPGQVIEYTNDEETNGPVEGWSLVFHPDLIRKSDLAGKIDRYGFFDYASNEALHLSFDEKTHIEELRDKIEFEYSHNLDSHSLNLINANLELLLDYCLRYYDRQFLSRTNLNQDLIAKFEKTLKVYYQASKAYELGLPSIAYCANELNLSPKYLSDLLKKETGRAAQEHIHQFLIEKDKNLLLNSTDSISEVAYALGFEYPQHFSNLFKSKTGSSPSDYRSLN